MDDVDDVSFQSCSLTCHGKDVKFLGVYGDVCSYVQVCPFGFLHSADLLFGALIYNTAVYEHGLCTSH